MLQGKVEMIEVIQDNPDNPGNPGNPGNPDGRPRDVGNAPRLEGRDDSRVEGND